MSRSLRHRLLPLLLAAVALVSACSNDDEDFSDLTPENQGAPAVASQTG